MLHQAIADRDWTMVNTLIEETKGSKLETLVNEKNSEGDSPLHVAIKKGYTHLVAQICNVEVADLDLENKRGKTPIAVATKLKQDEIVLLLLLSGAARTVDEAGEKSNPVYALYDSGPSRAALIKDYPAVKELTQFTPKPPPLVFIKQETPSSSSLSSRDSDKPEKSKKERKKSKGVLTSLLFWGDNHDSEEEESPRVEPQVSLTPTSGRQGRSGSISETPSDKSPRRSRADSKSPTRGPIIKHPLGGSSASEEPSPRGLMLSGRSTTSRKAGLEVLDATNSSGPTTAELFKEDEMESWPKLKIIAWLKTNNLEFLKPIYINKKTSSPDLTKMEAPKLFIESSSEVCRFAENPDRRNYVLLQSAPFAQLLEYLVMDEKAPLFNLWSYETFTKDFFCTFQNFTTKTALFEFLSFKFFDDPKEDVSLTQSSTGFKKAASPEQTNAMFNRKKRILKLFEKWVTKDNAADFLDPDLQKTYLSFIKTASQTPQLKDWRFMKNIISDLRKKQAALESSATEGNVVNDIFDCSPVLIARWVTHTIERLLDDVPSSEFLRQAYSEKHKQHGPNIWNLFNFIRQFGGWMNYEILHRTEGRARVIDHFLLTTKHLYEIHNFCGVAIMVSTLTGSTLGKLKKDWTQATQALVQELPKWEAVISNVGKFKAYKDALAALPPGASWLPFLLISVGDIEKLDEVTPNHTDEPKGWINWNKQTIVSKIISAIKVENRGRYDYPKNPTFQAYFESKPLWKNGNANYNIAVLHENNPTPCNKVFAPNVPISSEDIHQLKTLAGGTSTYVDGDLILNSTEPNRFVYLILSGTVAMKRALKTKTGINYVGVGGYGVNDMFGEVQVFLYGYPTEHNASNLSCFAKGTVEVIAIDIETASDLQSSKQTVALAGPQLYRLLCAMGCRIAVDINQTKEASGGDSPKQQLSNPLILSGPGAMPTPGEEFGQLNTEFGVSEPLIRVFTCQYKSTPGRLFVTESFICFLGNNIGIQKKEKISYHGLSISSKRKHTINFGDDTFKGVSEDVKELVHFFHSIQSKRLVTAPSAGLRTLPRGLSKKINTQELTHLILSEDQWALILKGAETTHFKSGQVILGSDNLHIHQLISGKVQIVDTTNQKVFGELTAPQLIGSVAFLLQQPNKRYEVKAVGDVSITTICPYFLEVLFSYQPQLASQFMYYIGRDLATKATSKTRLPVVL